MFTRKDVAAQLAEAARLLEVLGEDPFRARSLQTAARAFEAFEGDVQELYREGRLTDVRGVGSGTEAELKAMFEEGELPLLIGLRQRVPESVRELFAVSGLGAKRIGVLWRSGVVGLEGLVSALEAGRVAELPGFGAKSTAKMVEAARFALAARSSMRLDEAESLSEAIVAALRSEFRDLRAEPAGELRRGLETVTELEIVVAGVAPAALAEVAERLLDRVDTSGLAGTLMGRPVRFTEVPERAFGAALALRTGSAEFVERLRSRARERGVDLDDPVVLAQLPAVEEADLFGWLDLTWVPPELREQATPVPVPGLLGAAELRGLVHNHSTWSDGALSIREMAATARELGFAYLAMADHSRSSTVANGLTVERLRAQAEEVVTIREELTGPAGDFELLHGIEVDILADGRLDYPDEVLASLDYTVASVHQNFGLSRQVQTERILAAVRNPHVDILGHATGRLLLRRPGYDLDLERVIEACAETGTVIEINANPRRLDLDWRWVALAREAGCRFSIDPDAHTADGFDDLRYGVIMARKAGLTAEHVVNTAGSGRDFLARLGRP